MSDTTNIVDLPSEPISSQGDSPVQGQGQGPIQNPSGLDPQTLNQLMNGLKMSSAATQLQSRDIPMDNHISNDPQVMPNYIPPSQVPDYISSYDNVNRNDIIHQYNKNTERVNSLDELYNDIQLPLLIAVLYFLFQLPFFKKVLFQYIPFLFSSDGHYNINGFLFTSCLFGMFFYILRMVCTIY
jgi:hypothetical protein